MNTFVNITKDVGGGKGGSGGGGGGGSSTPQQDEQTRLKEKLFALLNSSDGDAKDNHQCADCGITDNVEWASSTLAIFLCVDCSGMHRKLSSDFSRVKSVRLDNWKPEEVQAMAAKGNRASNAYFLARLEPFKAFYPFPRGNTYFFRGFILFVDTSS